MGLGRFELPSRAPEALKIAYSALRGNFQVYLQRYSREAAQKIQRDLDRFLFNRIISSPLDVMNLFQGLSPGQIHNLDRALRALLNFCLTLGYSEEWIARLKKAIPRDPEFMDLKVPEENEVSESLRRISRLNPKYQSVWLICLESGLRLTEAVDLVNRFDQSRVTRLNGFLRIPIGSFRGSKIAYYAYFTEETLIKLKETGCAGLTRMNASQYFRKKGMLPAKYLRKFAFHKMVELGVPESVADFIEGRVPRTIGARHYMNLVKQADQYYPKYAEYIKSLKEKSQK